MSATPPPPREIPAFKMTKKSFRGYIIRFLVSFLLGVTAFLTLLVVTGHKSIAEILDMIKSTFM